MDAIVRQFMGRTISVIGAIMLLASIALLAIWQMPTLAFVLCMAGAVTILVGVIVHLLDVRYRTAKRPMRDAYLDHEDEDEDLPPRG